MFKTRQLRPILHVLLILATCGMSYGQENIVFDHITAEDGLSQSDINCIYQDKQGFMWFGTHDGLNKYDGYGFTVYNPDNNIPSNINSNLIYTIVGDDEDNLWIGTTGSGLNYFNRATETFTAFRHEKGNTKSLDNDHISILYRDSENRLWIGTNEGLNMVDLEKDSQNLEFQRFNSEQEPFITGWDGKSIYAIYEDSKNQLLVGGPGGLCKLAMDPKGKSYFRLVNEDIGLPIATVQCIAEDTSGRLLIGTDDGLYHQKGSEKARKLIDGDFNSLVIDKNNHLWAGTNNGLFLFENFRNQRDPKLIERFTYDPRNSGSISKNIVESIYMDRTGIIWIGTNGGGVNKYDPERKQFRHVRKTSNSNSLSYDKIRVIYEDSNGTLWIGTEGGGLNMLTEKKDNGKYSGFKHFQEISRAFALCEVEHDNKKILLVGAESTPGLFQLDITDPGSDIEKSLTAFEDIKQSVFTLFTDSYENIWIGTYGGGLHRWVPSDTIGEYNKDLFVHLPEDVNSISSNIIRNIYEDKNGNMWFATGDGLCKLSQDERSKKWPKFTIYKNRKEDTSSISHNYILSLFESERGDFWVGTLGGGLNQFIPGEKETSGSFVSYSDKDGLPNNAIKGILEESNGSLWLSTNQGLSRFDVEKKTFKNYDVYDGLQSNEFLDLACFKREDGEMLFGGINGFNAFYPESIVENTIEAETVVTNFSIFNKPVKIGQELNGRPILEQNINTTKKLKLKYKENSFAFEFAALHYAAPSKNKFAYTLQGFDKDWIQTTSNKRFANYTNLEPGSYKFKVKASNNDGVWDTTPSEIAIEVIPPFWRTKIAYTIYGLFAMGLFWLFWRYTFIRTTEKHQLELEHLEKEKSEEMQRMKLEFFTNISHEFRTPLTLLKGPLDYLQKKGDTLKFDKVKEQYGLMQKNTDYLMRLVNQLLDFRIMGQGKMRLVVRNSNITEFIREVGEPFQFLAHKRFIDFEVTSSNKRLLTWFDHDALEKILNNLLSNAFKFTPDHGRICVTISEGKDHSHVDLPLLKGDISDYLVIQVKDSGTGISKDNLQHIFDRFYVEKDKNQKNLNGAGIGLSFVKNLVELHQGKITVTSEPAQGTNFMVVLPKYRNSYENSQVITIKEATDGDFAMRSSEAESFAIGLNDEIVDRDLSGNRPKLPVLLIVDDNRDIRSFINSTLEGEYIVHEAENGAQGLEIALKIMPNIILTDVVMPVMDGIELCQKVKTRTATSHIPVLMITAKSSQESELQGLQHGADDYIRKPFDIELLQLKLNNIIKQRNDLRKRFNREINLQPKEVTVTSTDEVFLKQAIAIVEKHMMNSDLNVEMMVKEMGYSRTNLFLKFKEITGLSSSEFIRNIRLKRAVQLFDQSDLSVKEIMFRTGFNTASYFSKCFKKQFGVVPSEYVRKMKDKKEIQF